MAGDNEQLIVDVVGDNPDRQLDALLQKMDAVADRIVQINKVAGDIGNISFKDTNLRASVNEQGKLVDVMRTADQLMAQYNGHSKELTAVMLGLAKAETETANSRRVNNQALKAERDAESALTKGITAETQQRKAAIQVIDAENKARASAARATEAEMRAEQTRQKIAAKGTQEQVGQYDQLRKAYNEAAKAAKEIGVAEGINSAKFKQAAADTKKMYDTLYAVESAVGQNQRGVGQYERGTAGLSNAVQQILREAPSAANSLNTFFLAISNNLPILFDEIGRVNVRLGELKSEAAAANVQLQTQSTIQQGAATAAKEAEETLSAQVEGIIASVGASKEQAAALRENIASTVQGAAATGENTAVIAANTEQLAVNAGATAEEAAALRVQAEATALATQASIRQTAALEAQTVATAEANAIATKAPSVLKGIIGSVLSFNTVLTLGVLALTLWGGKIIDGIGNLFKSQEAIDRLKLSVDGLNKALESSEYTHAVSQINELRINIDLAKEGFIDKTKVVHQYNETIGQTTGEVKTLNEAEAALIKNADAYVKMTLYKAAANLALEEGAKKALDAEKERIKSQEDFATFSERVDEKFGIQSDVVRTRQKNRQLLAIRDAEQAQKAQEDLARTFQEKAAKIAAGFNFDFFGGAQDESKQKQKREKAAKDYTKLYERVAKDIAEFGIRLRTPTSDEVEEWTKEIQQSLDGSSVKVELNSILKVNSEKLSQDIAAAEAETNRTLLGIENSYQAGLYKSTKDYEAAKLKAVEEGADRQTQLRIQSLKNVQTYLPQFGKEYNNIQAQIDAAELEQQKRHNDKKLENEKDYNTRRKELIKDIKDARVQLEEQGIDVVNTAIQSQISAEEDQYSKRIDQINTQKQADIDAVNASTASQQDKQTQIAQIEAKATAATEVQEKARRKLVREGAMVERAAALLKLGVDTAQKVAAIQLQAAVLLSNPVTAGLAPLALSQIPIALGAGALGAAGILATKLPELFVGTDGEYFTGAAVTDERGPELYLEQGGRVYLGSDQGANIKNFTVPTQVVPADMTKQLLQMSMAYNLGTPFFSPSASVPLDVSELKAGLGRIEQAIKSQPVPQMHADSRGIGFFVKRGMDVQLYLNNI